jgi:hypothetical protein
VLHTFTVRRAYFCRSGRLCRDSSAPSRELHRQPLPTLRLVEACTSRYAISTVASASVLPCDCFRGDDFALSLRAKIDPCSDALLEPVEPLRHASRICNLLFCLNPGLHSTCILCLNPIRPRTPSVHQSSRGAYREPGTSTRSRLSCIRSTLLPF